MNVGAFPQTTDDAEVMWRENDDSNGVEDLLGFDFDSAETVDRSGLRALINSALVSHRRMPMLEVIFDRTARLMTTSLRQLADETVEVALDDVTSTRFADFQQSIAPPSVIGVARAPALDGHILLVADGGLLLSIVDALLGGRRGAGGLDASERGFTAIELAIAQRVFAALTDNLGEAFRPVIDGGFVLQRIETTPRFAAIAQGASVCALAKFRVRFEGHGGKAAVLIPHAALEPVRSGLAHAFISEAKEAERAWSAGLSREVCAASLEIEAIIAERSISLGDLNALRPGDTLIFRRAGGASADLRVGRVRLGEGRVGRSGPSAALRIDADFAGLRRGEAG